MPHLIIKEGTYYSQGDENAFFKWLESISGVSRVVGSPTGLIVTLRSRSLSESSLRELIALYFRYSLPMAALAQFETPKNTAWFRGPKAYWHKAVFRS